jgi:hypothetical protein
MIGCGHTCVLTSASRGRILTYIALEYVLNTCIGMPTSADVWDPALYPRSLGDAVCLAHLAAPEADAQARALVDGVVGVSSVPPDAGGEVGKGTEEQIVSA